MTPLALLLARIGWSRPEASARLGHHRTTWDDWCKGLRPAPADVLGRLERIAEAVERETAG